MSQILAIDIETSGPSMVKHGILSIGAIAGSDAFEVNIALEGREYDTLCLEQFWKRHPKAHAHVTKDPLAPKEAMARFAAFLDRHNRAMIVSDNPSFDIGWLNLYLALYTERLPINYTSGGEHRMIWDAGTIEELWWCEKPKSLHTPLSDAKKIAEVFKAQRRHFSIR
ncbi:MAG: hypothetical protein MRY21_02950 [Simkaniaceae bacterium]|nr:hypothetical protein [Simkaniaceae bacterium]